MLCSKPFPEHDSNGLQVTPMLPTTAISSDHSAI
jgi:hypothetical protein